MIRPVRDGATGVALTLKDRGQGLTLLGRQRRQHRDRTVFQARAAPHLGGSGLFQQAFDPGRVQGRLTGDVDGFSSGGAGRLEIRTRRQGRFSQSGAHALAYGRIQIGQHLGRR